MTAVGQSLESLKVDITVHRASQLPELKTWGGDNRKFYVTVFDASAKRNKKQTEAIRSAGNAVNWDETLGNLVVRRTSQITLSLYAKHRISRNILIGTIKIDPISTKEAFFLLVTSSDGQAPTVVLTINVRGGHNTEIVAPSGPSGQEAEPTLIPVPVAAAQSAPEEDMLQEVQRALTQADDAVTGINVCDEWERTVQNVQWVMKTVEKVADLHPYTKVAWTVISAIPEIFLKQFELDANIQTLVKTMRETFNLTQAEELLKAIKPNTNQGLILKVMLKHVTICTDVIQRYAQDKGFLKRTLSNITGEVRDEIKGLCDTLLRLRRDLLDNAIINMQIAVHLIQKSTGIMSSDIVNLDFDVKINDLPYKSGWNSTANKNGCLEGTRADFLEYILEWIKNPSSRRGLVLFGQAGTGKSSIAFEIASRFCFEEHPGSYFSFSRAQRSTQKDHHLFTTIIRDMSDQYPPFKLALGKLITNNTPLRTSDDFNQLFSTLLLEPLETIGTAEVPDLIVIDALDESAEPEKLASFLSQSLNRLPRNFRVLITSRSEGNIEVHFRKMQESSYEIHRMDDPTLAPHLDDDIRLYFRTHLSEDLFQRHGEALARKAQGLFQWAAVACGYLNKPPPGYTIKKCLRGLIGEDEGDKQFIQGLQSLKLYTLYDEILSAYFISDFARSQFRYAMGHLFYAFEALSINTLSGLQHYVPGDDGDDESVLAVVKFMGSLLSNVTSDDKDMPVVPLHTSFRDFLIDTTNTHSFSLDLLVSHSDLTHACLDLMLHELRFNICQLQTSHLRNTKVADLQFRIDKFISPSLFYACRFWDDHLGCVPFNEVLFYKLEQFFSKAFLFWLEVLSVTKTVPLAVQAITSTLNWLRKAVFTFNPEVDDKVKALVALVTDALAFLRFFGGAIATSAPHIYISALPFAPKSSEVFKTYSPKFPPTLTTIQGQLDYWPALEMSLASHDFVCCVDISPDGQWIVSGMDNGTILLWNATTGIQEASPLSGHTGEVQSIAFSSDGQHIVSGSRDYTIRLWNMATGTVERNPWIGHVGSVISVAFSPDEAYVLSVSEDATVRIWNVANGSMEGSPLPGNDFLSVAFSSDGERIVSGSYDSIIRIWKFDSAKGRVEVIPLLTLQAPGPVLSVAISPNGQQIAAGCNDPNVYLWDVLTEPTEGNPLAGHAGSVVLVRFSPDGRHLVSAGSDGKLRLWNTSTSMVEGLLLSDSVISMALSSDGQRIVSGNLVIPSTINVWNVMAATRVVESSGALTRHASAVVSVAYSDVGEQHLVASGFHDGTICLWDVEKRGPFGNPLRGHTDTVRSVAFSSNGQQLLSGSQDGTVRVWNVDGGTEESILVGHSRGVWDAVFSPDGHWIVSGDSQGMVWLWNTVTGAEESRLGGCSGSISSVRLSPDSQQVVCGTNTGQIWVWDISGQEKKEGRQLGQHEYDAEIRVVSFVTSDRIISCDQWGTIHYWNTSTGKIEDVSFNLEEYNQEITSSTLSPDHSRLAAGLYDGTITIWNLATQTREALGLMIGHTACVNFLAFSPDGQQLVSSAYDSTIRVWDVSRELNTSPERPLDFNVAHLNKDGWLVGKQRELLVWIPQHYQLTCRRPDNLIALFPPHHPHLEFSEVIHGEDWHTAYKASEH